ncbi:YybH family protein [Shewanella maritima]|uniref:YybH family protein n=1 Tax=Shewanella maritima TaxID=2520507 RepID=UPI003734FB00
MRYLLGLMLCFFGLQANAVPSDEIIKVLTAQEQAWNQGDIDGYMQGYYHSDKLRFVSGGQLRYGWNDINQRYKRSYPNSTAMGQLSFNIKDIKFLSNYAALVVGRWTLTRDKDTPSGVFTLLFERIDDEWVITHDHSSG